MNSAIEIKKDNYGLKMLLLIGILLSVMVMMFNKIQQQEPITPSFTIPVMTDKPIHILKSYATAVTYQKNGLDKSQYTLKLEQFNKYIKSLGYKTEYIEEEKIGSLSRDAILFIPDAIALSTRSKEMVKRFVSEGGNLFFNNSSGFSDEKGTYRGDGFVKDITKLEISKDKNFVNFKESIFLTQRILSPLINVNTGILLEASIYDPVPIFITTKHQEPDFLLTTYDQTNPPLDKDGTGDFSLAESGTAWHGYYGQGKWYYMNLPSYFFYDAVEHLNDYKRFMNAIINYLATDVVIQKFPYIDKENIVFISEDTEYKFKNFKKFSDLAQKYKIPVTAFIVSSLASAEEHQDMMREIALNPYVEFGSHSHLHKKIIDTNASYAKQETADTKVILDRYASQPIIGFRPPREELDSLMKKYLQEGGFKYILSITHKYLYPRFDKKYQNLLIIPRHGTDDYSYLINLDWDQNQIVKQIKKETEFVTALDGIFTLSIHTHLFAYNNNINIVEEYFKYLNANPKFTPLNGRSIAQRVTQNENIDIHYSKTGKLITLSIKNRNKVAVENFSCKLFKNPNMRIKSIKCNETSGRKNTKERDTTNIKLKELKPNSTTTVYIEVEKIS
jgi:peptidoglycan/xylan/chitin deacetylase (PgdA/CDA1 family)